MNLVTPKVGAKHELLFNEPASDISEKTCFDLTLKYFARLKKLDRDKHSSLFCPAVCNKK
jgi:hypothetical protein